jgi:hypothetical protein
MVWKDEYDIINLEKEREREREREKEDIIFLDMIS